MKSNSESFLPAYRGHGTVHPGWPLQGTWSAPPLCSAEKTAFETFFRFFQLRKLHLKTFFFSWENCIWNPFFQGSILPACRRRISFWTRWTSFSQMCALLWLYGRRWGRAGWQADISKPNIGHNIVRLSKELFLLPPSPRLKGK